MKKIYFLLFFVPMFASAQSKFQFGTYFSTYSPFKAEMPKMSTNYGWGYQFAYKPSTFVPVSIEFSNTLGMYYSRTMQETYQFDSTSSTTTDVTYTSGMKTNLLGAKVHLGHDYRKVRGYVKPQIGWATMKSKIAIAPPNDTDDCQPMDRTTTQKFRGFVYGGEAGVELDMSLFCKNVLTENKHFLYVGGSYLRGFNDFEYINNKYMVSHNHGPLPEGGAQMSTTDEDGRDVTATFINVTTNEVHDHKIAELYKTGLEYWGLKIGYIIYF